MVLPFLSLYVTESLSLPETAAGWMLAAYGIGSCAGSFVGGLITDRIGPFRIQVVALLVSGLGYLAMPLASSFSALATIVVLTSFTADAFRPANAASVTLLSPPEMHKRAFSLNRLAINLGYTVGPTVGGILATISFQFLFWIDAVTSWFAAATFIFFLGVKSPTPATSDHPRSPESEAQVDKLAYSTAESQELKPWQNSQFMAFLMLTFATFAVFFQLISTFPLFLKSEYGLSKFQIGTLFGANTLCVVAFEMVLIQMLDKKRLLMLIAWGSLFMCLGFGLLAFGAGYWFALATVMVWTLGEMLAMPQMLAYVSKSSTVSTRSLYMGCYTTCVALSMMIGPLLGTQLYNWDHYTCWHFATLVGLVVGLGFYVLESTTSAASAERLQASSSG